MAFRIAIIYIVLGGLWILFSDQLAYSLFPTLDGLHLAQTYKGWFFILASAIVLFLVLHFYFRKLDVSEKKLTEREAQYRELVEGTSDLFANLTRNGEILYINPNSRSMLGRLETDLIGTSVFELIAPEDRNLADVSIDELKAQHKENGHLDLRLIDTKGKIHYTRVTLRFHYLEDGSDLKHINCYGRDITDWKQAVDDLNHRLKIEHAVSNVSSLLAGSGDVDMNEILEILGKVVQASRAHLVRLHDDGMRMSSLYQWCSPGVEVKTGIMQDLKVKQDNWWYKQISEKGMVLIEDTRSLPEEACYERELLLSQNILAVLAIPLWLRNKRWGFLGFDTTGYSKQWKQEDLQILRTASEAIMAYKARKQDESELEISRQHFQSVFEATPDAIIISNYQGFFVDVNPGFTEVTGYSREEVIGKDVTKLKFWENPEKRDQMIYLMRTKGYIDDFEATFRAKNGQSRQALMSGRPIMIQGAPHLLTISKDITVRKEVETALVESEANYRAIYNASNDALIVAMLDGQRILDTNRKVLDLLEYTKEEARKLAFLDLLEEHPPHTIRKARHFVDAAVNGVPQIFEWLIKSKNGKHIWAEINMRRTVIGGRDQLLIVLHDITKRRQAEEVLRESEGRYRMLMEQSSDGIALIDNDYRIVEANKKVLEIFGYSQEEFIGLSIFNMVHDEYAYLVKEDFDDWRKGLHTLVVRQVLHRSGRELFAEISVSILPDGLILATLRDVTDRLKEEEERSRHDAQLRQQQKLESIGTLASGVAHEINNPINSIMNYAQLIFDESVQDTRQYDFSNEIIGESKRVAMIVRNLLAFARQEQEIHSPANIKTLVDNTLSLIRALLRKHQITLKTEIPPNLPEVVCRNQQIQQVLMNLVTNAADALNERFPSYHEDKIIHISAQTLEEDGIRWLRTSVRDNGMGIDTENLGRIFDPFFTTKPRGVGTGLGLSVSHGIMREHEGRLLVESEAGKYTCFHMDLDLDHTITELSQESEILF